MPEPTLSLKYEDLAGEVGLFLGYGRGAAKGDPAWTTRQKAAIESHVRSGYRRFLQPPAVDNYPAGYDWSFLTPVTSQTLLEGNNSLKMPDDFGGVVGEITLSISGQSSLWAIVFTGEGRVRARQAELPDTTGRPTMACIVPLKPTTLTKGQQFQLQVWPIADQDYTLRFKYYVNPDAISEQFPYHMGGTTHGETVLESCLAVAESRSDDTRGLHAAEFRDRLIASINYDRRFKAQVNGYNRDLSDQRDQTAGRQVWGPGGILVNDVLY